ncbi:VOC family protein [Paenibacillus sp. GD4]|uniref:VOC family protein n=1 Tax=Paenibacillus sp. GD4 TaxID=3068890 RepID=UPI00279644DC|nr:VOC family protein [Paenibacillus sp. GD4]MDQ1912228.1 VOC family protein [Paenibacillus sp. GD4]
MDEQLINHYGKMSPSLKEEAIVKSITCIELPVSNMQRAVDFYVFQLGFYMNTTKNRLPIEPDNTEVFIYPASGGEIMLVQTDGEERLAFTHKGRPNHVLILEMSEDIETCHRRLSSAGIKTSPIKDSGGCGKSFDVFDPDGNFIKLWFGFPR